jgi:hypothetical protein
MRNLVPTCYKAGGLGFFSCRSIISGIADPMYSICSKAMRQILKNPAISEKIGQCFFRSGRDSSEYV